MFTKKPYSNRQKIPAHPGRRPLESLSHNELVTRLDREVSLYVRRVHEIAPGLNRCYTCGQVHETKNIQAGHYISRRYYGTRYDLRNIRPQCAGCNGARSGEPLRFRQNLVDDLGSENVEDLERTARLYGEAHLSREWLVDQIRFFRKKNNDARKK